MHLKLLFVFLICFNYSQAQMNDTALLIGKIEHKSLKEYSWYAKNYTEYSTDKTTIEALKPIVSTVKIMVIMGTWCGDSHEYVPAFYKVAAEIGLSENNIELIAVDRKKHCPIPDISALEIEYVPTFFVFDKGVLKGKIVETPTKTIEEDLLNLLQK